MAETTYLVEIQRADLAGFANRVANEEAGAAAFIDSRVAALDNLPTNLVSFRELDPGQVPDPPSFVRHGQVPAGKTVAWTGVLLIGGLNVAVQMFR